MERAGFMADFNVLLWNGYGYELTRETSLGNIVLSMSGPGGLWKRRLRNRTSGDNLVFKGLSA